MVLGKRSKVGIRGIKGKFEERERDFWILGNPEKKRRKNQRGRRNSKLEDLEFLK